MVRVGVMLSGCGVYDGAEIQEAVIVLLALDRAGVDVLCMAPNVDQMHVVNHLSGEPTEEVRNVLVESARISRGEITDLKEVQAGDMDALIVPGGFGAAKNLCDFAVQGAEASVHPEVARLMREVLAAKKPLGVACIAPAVLAVVLRDVSAGSGVELTIGDDAQTAEQLEAMGVRHLVCPVGEAHVDSANRVVSTPAYMLAGRISEAAQGLERLVAEVLRLVG